MNPFNESTLYDYYTASRHMSNTSTFDIPVITNKVNRSVISYNKNINNNNNNSNNYSGVYDDNMIQNDNNDEKVIVSSSDVVDIQSNQQDLFNNTSSDCIPAEEDGNKDDEENDDVDDDDDDQSIELCHEDKDDNTITIEEERCDSTVRSTSTSFDYTNSILYNRAQYIINQVETIENYSRRQRQESYAIDAIVDELIIAAPVNCLEGLRTVQQSNTTPKNNNDLLTNINDSNINNNNITATNNNNSYSNNEISTLNNMHIDFDGALADDLSSCADDEHVSTSLHNTYRQYDTTTGSTSNINTATPFGNDKNHNNNNMMSSVSLSEQQHEIRELQARIRACYQAVVSIQACADLREAKLQLEVSKLQTELDIERIHNTQLLVQVELLKKQNNNKQHQVNDDDDDDTTAVHVDYEEVRVETHINNLVIKCQKYLSENLLLKQGLYDNKTSMSVSVAEEHHQSPTKKSFLGRKNLQQVIEQTNRDSNDNNSTNNSTRSIRLNETSTVIRPYNNNIGSGDTTASNESSKSPSLDVSSHNNSSDISDIFRQRTKFSTVSSPYRTSTGTSTNEGTAGTPSNNNNNSNKRATPTNNNFLIRARSTPRMRRSPIQQFSNTNQLNNNNNNNVDVQKNMSTTTTESETNNIDSTTTNVSPMATHTGSTSSPDKVIRIYTRTSPSKLLHRKRTTTTTSTTSVNNISNDETSSLSLQTANIDSTNSSSLPETQVCSNVKPIPVIKPITPMRLSKLKGSNTTNTNTSNSATTATTTNTNANTKVIGSPLRRPTYMAFTKKILRGQHVPPSSPGINDSIISSSSTTPTIATVTSKPLLLKSKSFTRKIPTKTTDTSTGSDHTDTTTTSTLSTSYGSLVNVEEPDIM